MYTEFKKIKSAVHIKDSKSFFRTVKENEEVFPILHFAAMENSGTAIRF